MLDGYQSRFMFFDEEDLMKRPPSIYLYATSLHAARKAIVFMHEENSETIITDGGNALSFYDGSRVRILSEASVREVHGARIDQLLLYGVSSIDDIPLPIRTSIKASLVRSWVPDAFLIQRYPGNEPEVSFSLTGVESLIHAADPQEQRGRAWQHRPEFQRAISDLHPDRLL